MANLCGLAPVPRLGHHLTLSSLPAVEAQHLQTGDLRLRGSASAVFRVLGRLASPGRVRRLASNLRSRASRYLAFPDYLRRPKFQ